MGRGGPTADREEAILTPPRGGAGGPVAPGLEALFRRDYPRLVALARLLIDRPDEGEEIVQEAFARAYAAGDRLDTRADPRAYVQRSVVNLARDGLRRRRTVRRAPMSVVRSGDSADVGTVLDEDQRVLRVAVQGGRHPVADHPLTSPTGPTGPLRPRWSSNEASGAWDVEGAQSTEPAGTTHWQD